MMSIMFWLILIGSLFTFFGFRIFYVNESSFFAYVLVVLGIITFFGAASHTLEVSGGNGFIVTVAFVALFIFVMWLASLSGVKK